MSDIQEIKWYKEDANEGCWLDERDNRDYKVVRIGKQIWMAENLQYEVDGCKVYDNDPSNLSRYGYLYTWNAAKNAVPKGWHLPTNKEWNELIEYVINRFNVESNKVALYLKGVEWKDKDYSDILAWEYEDD